jgi:chromosomal replication initiator protein
MSSGSGATTGAMRRTTGADARKGGTAELSPALFFDLARIAEGDENEFTLSAVRQVLETPGEDFSPLFIHGPAATGKSHLLFGLARALSQKFPRKPIIALTAGDFLERCDEAWSARSAAQLRRHWWRAEAFLLDDLHMLHHRPAAIQELLHLFNKLHSAGKQMVFTARRSPAELSSFPAAIRSRLGSGLTCSLDTPGPDLLAAILHRKAAAFKLKLSQSAATGLARVVRNAREVEGVVRRLDQTTPGRRRCGRAVTLARVRQLLEELESPPITIADVAQAASSFYQVPLAKVRSESRQQELVLVRQLAMYLARTLTDAPLTEIGAYFGGRDHSTVLYACQRAEELMAADSRIGRAAREIRRAVRERPEE